MQNTLQLFQRVLAVSACLLISSHDLSAAESYFVDAYRGNDNTNDGKSWSQPFQTISKAASVSGAGDHIRINHGVYREQISDPPSGTQAEPVLYEAVGEVVVDGENIRANGFFLSSNGSWVTLKGIRIVNTRSHGIYINRSGVVVENCEIFRCGHADSTWALYLTSNAHDGYMRFNRLRDNDHGIYKDRGNRYIIDRNTITRCENIGLTYHNDSNTTRANSVINNIVSKCSGRGIQLNGYNLTSDRVEFNNSFQNNPNWYANSTDSATSAGNLSIDPEFVADTVFLKEFSPMIEAGTVDETSGQIATIGALGIGKYSSSATDAWSDWWDQDGAELTTSARVEIDSEGNIKLRPGQTEAVLRSPVIAAATKSTIRAVRIDAVQAPFLPPNEKQVIDSDNTTVTPEVRYRADDSAFDRTASLPDWTAAHPGERLNDAGLYFQMEVVLRGDGI